MIKKIILSCCLAVPSFSVFAETDRLVGTWRSIDDTTGFSKALIEIQKDSKGIYTAKIVDVIPRPGYTPKTHCYKCPAPFTNQPILGIQILNKMIADTTKPGEYKGGTILDPLSGKMYKARLKLNPDASRLTVRGFVGVQVIGRSQLWLRHTP